MQGTSGIPSGAALADGWMQRGDVHKLETIVPIGAPIAGGWRPWLPQVLPVQVTILGGRDHRGDMPDGR